MAKDHSDHLLNRQPTRQPSGRSPALVPNELAGTKSEPVVPLSVGMPPSMGGYITSEAVKTYTARHPAVRLNVSILAGEECYEQLVERYLDIAVIASRRGQRGVDMAPLLSEAVGLFGAHKLLDGMPDSVSIGELASLPLVLAPAPTLVQDLLNTELMRAGMRLKIAVEANLWAAPEFVRQGVGLSIFSESAKGTFDPASVRFVRVLVPPILWSIATLSYRPVTPAATDGSCVRLRPSTQTMSGPMTSSRAGLTMAGSSACSTSSTSSPGNAWRSASIASSTLPTS